MSTAAKHRLTEQEYLARERAAEFKSEFVDGEVFAMSGGSLYHSLIAGNFIRHLGNALDGRPCRVFTCDVKVRTPATRNYFYPDVSALCGPADPLDREKDVLLNPSLVVEVLSPSTEAFDRGRKFLSYRSIPSLVDYVLVSSEFPLVEHYHRLPEDTWSLTTHQEPEAVLTLPGIGATLRVRDIYTGTDYFPTP